MIAEYGFFIAFVLMFIAWAVSQWSLRQNQKLAKELFRQLGQAIQEKNELRLEIQKKGEQNGKSD